MSFLIYLFYPCSGSNANDLTHTRTVFYYTFSQTINGKYKLPPCVNHFPPEREPATPDPAVCLLSKMKRNYLILLTVESLIYSRL
uniref:Uncharacterized protein n=1 Tax=Anas platyrhynchos platyrhynchos TaxID=8840 RepID=A0A493TBP4_ANAPP